MKRLVATFLGMAMACVVVSRANDLPLRAAPAIELSDFIVDALPPNFDTLDWDFLVDHPNISWQTDGVTRTETGMSQRVGLARIKVAGQYSVVLHQTWVEILWTVTLSSDFDEKHGVEEIVIKPGGDGENSCFGALYRGCLFTPAQALASPKLRSQLICSTSFASELTKVYMVSALNKNLSLLVYQQSGGSGGLSSWIEIHPLVERHALCAPNVGP